MLSALRCVLSENQHACKETGRCGHCYCQFSIETSTFILAFLDLFVPFVLKLNLEHSNQNNDDQKQITQIWFYSNGNVYGKVFQLQQTSLSDCRIHPWHRADHQKKSGPRTLKFESQVDNLKRSGPRIMKFVICWVTKTVAESSVA